MANSTSPGEIMCFCTDEDCLSSPSQTSTLLGLPQALRGRIENFLRTSNQQFHYCLSNTVCLTKRVLRSNGETYFKYYCDPHTDSLLTLRKHMLEYRDCRVDSSNAIEVARAHKTSNEHCCLGHDFCNIELQPMHSARDLNDLANQMNGRQTSHEPKEYVEQIENFVLSNASQLYDQQQHTSSTVNTFFSTHNIFIVSIPSIFMIYRVKAFFKLG
jgi:hypothetical protein